jgi:cbb3-type cytochrome oxidase maturation protein
VTVLLYLIPAALLLGLLGLLAFLWAMKTGQFDDLDGAAHRILFDDDEAPHAGPPGEPPAGQPTEDAGNGGVGGRAGGAADGRAGDPADDHKRHG